MIIKAGTYRFNDELTVFTDEHGQYDFPLQFTVRANFAIDTANQLLYEDSQTYEFNTFRFVRVTPPTASYDYFNVAYLPEIYGTTAVYHYFQSYPVNSYYWNTTAHALESDGYSNTDLAKGFGQTITVTADTEAEDTFGTWFADNTEAVAKPITKKFTRLYIGDTVATAGSKCFKRLTTEEPSANYLTFSSPNSFTLATYNATKNWDGTLEYSTDTRTWNEWDGVTTLSADGGVLYMRGTGNTKITGRSGEEYGWNLDGSNIACEGNIENLLDYESVANGEHPSMANWCYCNMFIHCEALTTAPELPATALTLYCYSYMFSGCSLTEAPALPATALAEGCYSNMFSWCEALTTAPALPATTLASNCYSGMFYGCTSLTSAPSLPATTLASHCYSSMFMTCTAITTIPELPATTLAKGSYSAMFRYCKNIKISTTQTGEYQTPYRIPTSGTVTTASDALGGMFFDTGGTFTDTPSINTTYYTSNTVI